MEEGKEQEFPIVHGGEVGHQQYRGARKMSYLPEEVRNEMEKRLRRLREELGVFKGEQNEPRDNF